LVGVLGGRPCGAFFGGGGFLFPRGQFLVTPGLGLLKSLAGFPKSFPLFHPPKVFFFWPFFLVLLFFFFFGPPPCHKKKKHQKTPMVFANLFPKIFFSQFSFFQVFVVLLWPPLPPPKGWVFFPLGVPKFFFFFFLLFPKKGPKTPPKKTTPPTTGSPFFFELFFLPFFSFYVFVLFFFPGCAPPPKNTGGGWRGAFFFFLAKREFPPPTRFLRVFPPTKKKFFFSCLLAVQGGWFWGVKVRVFVWCFPSFEQPSFPPRTPQKTFVFVGFLTIFFGCVFGVFFFGLVG